MIAGESLVGIWLHKLGIWHDHQRFYHKKNWPDLLDGQDFDFYHYTDIDKIRDSTKSVLIIDNLSESWHSFKHFLQYPRDRRYVIFSGGQWNTRKKHLPFRYKPIFHQWCLMEMADTYLSPQRFCFYSDTCIDFDCAKPLHFVSTIGNQRAERDRLVSLLCESFADEPVLIKYSGQCIIGDDMASDVISVAPGEFDPYTSLVDKYFHNISQTLPIHLYNSARFNLVVETDIDFCDVFFLTEKTVKCLITGMPFVVVSTPRFLYHLRRLGFRTYDSVWDESYDHILDTNQRIEAVVKLCRDLQNYNWAKIVPTLREISTHNKLHFSRLNKLSSQEFETAHSTLQGDWICPES